MKIIYTVLAFIFSISLIAQEDADIPNKDQVVLDDMIIQGSLAVGFDAVNGESFGFNTVVLKENNLRIKFWDTSTSASFPSNDWTLEANDSNNGGLNHFSIMDATAGRRIFTVEAGAPSNSIYVKSNGRLGLGTSSPVTQIHTKYGDTPTLRLEQDGSAGWGLQTWDVAGNETNFFVRDVTNGSKLPFRIFPNSPQNTLTLKNGNVGIGTDSPTSALEIRQSTVSPLIIIRNTGGTNGAGIEFTDDGSNSSWRIKTTQKGDIKITDRINSSNVFTIEQGAPTNTFYIKDDGHVGIGVKTPEAELSVNGKILCKEIEVRATGWPDYVFADDYKLKPLNEVEQFINEHKHLPGIPSEAVIIEEGVNLGEMNALLLEKIEELTLYMIELKKENEVIKSQMKELKK